MDMLLLLEFEPTLGGEDREAWCPAVRGFPKSHYLGTKQQPHQAESESVQQRPVLS